MDHIELHSGKEDKQRPAKLNSRRELLSTIGILIAAPLLAVFLTIFVFQSYEVDGPSMNTTLADNDRLIVNKTNKTWAKITGGDYVPERYSIIVFNYAGSISGGGEGKQLIKRVIGLPGDKILIKDGAVTIQNSAHPDGFYPDREGPQAAVIKTTDISLEETVDQGELFVMGDNRANSLDSRTFGAIKSKDVVGRLSIRIFPFDKIQKF